MRLGPVLLLVLLTGTGAAEDRPPAPDPQTLDLHERWLASSAKRSNSDQEFNPLYQELLKAPDADLCFLKTADRRAGAFADCATGWAQIALGPDHPSRRGGARDDLDLAASDAYAGSYGGPPPFRTLEPGAATEGSVCLQYFLRPLIDLPLPEGDYELRLRFDSREFAGIRPAGVQRTHAWDAEPVRFSVRGAPRRDPSEILEVIGDKAGLKWLRSDLISPRSDRRDAAWQAVYQYGDSRLVPLMERIDKEYPEGSPYHEGPGDLRPYEHALPARATR
jgi:hypothetical protein